MTARGKTNSMCLMLFVVALYMNVNTGTNTCFPEFDFGYEFGQNKNKRGENPVCQY